jgi:hypothetical protein
MVPTPQNIYAHFSSIKHADHGTDSKAFLPGCMRNRLLYFDCWGGGGRWIWNRFFEDQKLSINLPPFLLSVIFSPKIVPLSCLLPPKLCPLVDCCLEWLMQGYQSSSLPLADHRHLIAVASRPFRLVVTSPLVVISSLSRCRCHHARRRRCHHHCHRLLCRC